MTVQREIVFSGAGLPVEVPYSRYFDFKSALTGGEYRIFLAIPPTPTPDNGFAVMYVLDGNSSFSTAVAAVNGLAMTGEIRPAVIVGIGYQNLEPAALGAQRFRDLATPASPEWIGQLMERVPMPIPGLARETACQADVFLRVIQEEIRPAVAAMVKIDPADQTLMGHSLGGLAVLRALFTSPTIYRAFAAGSPSIWWGNGSVLADESSLAATITAGRAQPRIFLGVGEEEQKLTASALRFYGSKETAEWALQFVRMVDNAVDLGKRLSSLSGGARFAVSTVVFTDEDHISVIPAVISRGARFALRNEGNAPASPSSRETTAEPQP